MIPIQITNDYYQPIDAVPSYQQIGRSTKWNAYKITEIAQNLILNNVITRSLYMAQPDVINSPVYQPAFVGAPTQQGLSSWLLNQTNSQIVAQQQTNNGYQIANYIYNNSIPTGGTYV